MKLLPLAITLLMAGLILGAYLGNSPPEPAGDIAEYYGITESILNHGSISLSRHDEVILSQTLHPEYFSNPGYYIPGLDGKRYPVHFIIYSLLLVPLRWILQLIRIPPLHVFSLMNTLIFFTAILIVLHRCIKSTASQLIFLSLILSSPLLYFLWWPGPDMFSLALLLLALWYFLTGAPVSGSLLSAVASWHSQPLIIVSFGMLGYAMQRSRELSKRAYWTPLALPSVLILTIALLPYIYNKFLFGTWTPWTIFQDGWTRLRGFGIQNISGQKLWEQFFDLNIGVFWYAPALTIAGMIAFANNLLQKASAVKTKMVWVAAMLLTTLLAYQTNPAWHYGTAGFGPSRHAMVLIPFLITVIVYRSKWNRSWIAISGLLVISQIYVLSYNNYIFPIFTNTLYHTPIARLFLDRWPALYNPTPEIFVDRTNHTDLDHPTSAVYTTGGICKKAFVLPDDIDRISAECGPFPPDTKGSIYDETADGFYVNYP